MGTTCTSLPLAARSLKRRVSIDSDGNMVREKRALSDFKSAATVAHAAKKWRRMAAQSERDVKKTKHQHQCRCKGDRCAFSEESDLIVITHTFFFAAALLLTLATALVAFPFLFSDAPTLPSAPSTLIAFLKPVVQAVYPFLPASIQSMASCMDSHASYPAMQMQWCVGSSL